MCHRSKLPFPPSLFIAAHALWPLVFVFAGLHTLGSETPVLPLFAVGLALLGVDFLLMGLDFSTRPAEVLTAGVIRAEGAAAGAAGGGAHRGKAGGEAPPTAVYLVLRKHDFPGLWQFRYAPGQFVYLHVPKISAYPHPFSISSAAE